MKSLYGKLIIWVLMVLVFHASHEAFSQKSVLSQAQMDEQKYHYLDASEAFQGLSERGSREAALRVASNLYKARRYEEALPYYEYSDSLAMINNPEELFGYFECLKSMKRYEEADALVRTHLKEYGSLREFSLQSDKLLYYEKLRSYAGAKVERLPMNGRYSDISPTVYNDWLYFVSTRPASNNKAIHRINLQPFYNMYALPVAEAKPNGEQSNKAVVMPKGDFSVKEKTIAYGETKAVSLPNGLNKRYHDGPIQVSKSGKYLFFTSNWSPEKRPKTKPVEINLLVYWCEKNGEVWSEPKGVPFNSFNYSNQHAYFDEATSTMYFSSNMPGGEGGFDIWKSVLKDGNWSEPKNLGKQVNTPKSEVFPAIGPGSALFFSSNGWPGLGGLDVFMQEGKGGEPLNLLAGINTEKDDFGLYFTNDRMGYLTSNRTGSVGDDDIWSVELDIQDVVKAQDPSERLIVGLVKDAKTGAILDGVKVTVTGNFGKNYETAGQKSINDPVSGPIGDASKPEIVVTYMKDGYQPKVLRIKEWPADQRVLDISEALVKEEPNQPQPITRLLTGKYTDAKTGEELEGVSVTVSGGVAGGYMVARAGIHEMVTPGKGEIVVNVSKPGYKAKTLTFAEWPTAQQVQDISAKLEREEVAGPVAEKKRKEFIIYFDFDKYYIRKPDAWGTLEECLAYVTKEYPSSNLSLTGHTDSRAPLGYNVTLSRNRVETTKKWLAARGVDASRMGTGYDGEVKPAVPCSQPGSDPDTCLNEQQHQLNRRVVIVVEY